jgi:alpha-L-fucosidase
MIAGRELGQRRLTPEEIQKIIETHGWKSTITPREYWKDAAQFNPQQYEPEKWLRAARDAGFKYAVLTTRHHEGYALWPSASGDFHATRDLVKPYADACRKVGFYYSPPDWHFTQDTFTFMYYKVKRLNPESPDLDIDLKPCRRAPMTAAQKSAYDAHLAAPAYRAADQLRKGRRAVVRRKAVADDARGDPQAATLDPHQRPRLRLRRFQYSRRGARTSRDAARQGLVGELPGVGQA